jgi:hypothetical protein
LRRAASNQLQTSKGNGGLPSLFQEIPSADVSKEQIISHVPTPRKNGICFLNQITKKRATMSKGLLEDFPPKSSKKPHNSIVPILIGITGRQMRQVGTLVQKEIMFERW